MRGTFLIVLLACAGCALCLQAQSLKVVRKPHDPYGVPRPGPGQQYVPLRTSYFVQVESANGTEDPVLAGSVEFALTAEGRPDLVLISPGEKFGTNCTGRIFPSGTGAQNKPVLSVYVTSEVPLQPATRYTARLKARSALGAELSAREGTWDFTTEAADTTHEIRGAIDFQKPVVRWEGGFFTGFCKPSFCTSDPALLGTYDLMAEARLEYPRAWSLQRDFWMTGMDDQPRLLAPQLPNLVRERETRRISHLEQNEEATRLKLEDFVGHEQYGIDSGKPLSADFHAGDEVLIADGKHAARTRVIRAFDEERVLEVGPVTAPPGGWRLEFLAPAPERENPKAPGRFAWGGGYVRKFNPPGTPVFYWGRMDKEWDLAHRKYGRRLMPNFADAPGDLSVDGRNWTTAKDYVQLHEVTRTIAGRIIDRYGPASLSFPWSVFNEPDLGAHFWRTNWTELQRFYDYTTDALLRAFEDRGYDSKKVMVGGLELGGIFGTNLNLREFLAHCSPRAQVPGALAGNAAYGDARLEGKRSRRVEELCRAHQGRGTPCDFISIHAYNRSEMMAAKLARAKDVALEIDPEFYARLWINSHESCPDWNPLPDPAAPDSYLGNGYFPTWCADVVRRQLARAERDPRFGFGETILTIWPSPSRNFQGINNVTRILQVDENGDGRKDSEVLVATPVFHFLNLLSTLGPDYQVLPETVVGGHVVSGFASRQGREARFVLYAHNNFDSQSRSGHRFRIKLEVTGLPSGPVRVTQYHFDREQNSYYDLAQRFRDGPAGSSRRLSGEQIELLMRDLRNGTRHSKLAALHKLASAGPQADSAIPLLLELVQGMADEDLRRAGMEAVISLAGGQVGYSPEVVGQMRERSILKVTSEHKAVVGAEQTLELRTQLKANGICVVVVSRED